MPPYGHLSNAVIANFNWCSVFEKWHSVSVQGFFQVAEYFYNKRAFSSIKIDATPLKLRKIDNIRRYCLVYNKLKAQRRR